MRPKPLEEIIRDDDELDTKIKSEKKKIPSSPEEVLFGRVHLPPQTWLEYDMLGPRKKISLMDITPDAYPSVLEFIKDTHFSSDPLCRAMQILESEKTQAEYVSQIIYFLNGSASLMAVDSSGKIVGVLVGKIEDLDECSEKIVQSSTFTSKRFKTIQNFINFLTKNGNVHEKYKCKVFYKVHILAVRDDWLWKGLEKALITGALRLSSIMGLPRLAGVFTTYKNQCYMSEFKAVTDFEIYYSEWRTDRGLRIFRGTGKTEPRAALMSVPVPESFRPSMDDKELTESPPLTSDRGRRILKTRVPIWNELGINIACVSGNVC